MNPTPRRTPWRALVGLGALLAVAADKPPLPGYKTVKEATTREVAPPRPGHAGETGYLGVSLRKDEAGKLVVEEVQPDSPASRAGVRAGDVVAKLDGTAVRTPDRFRDALQMRGPGEEVRLGVVREGEDVEVRAKLGSTSRPRVVGGLRTYLGIALGLPKEGQGVPVEQVAPDSPAAKVGFKVGDAIFQVEGVELSNPMRLGQILQEKKPGDEFEITVRRDGADLALRPKLVAEPAGGGLGLTGNRAGRPGGFGGQQGAITVPIWKKPEFRLGVVGIDYPDVKHNAKVSGSDWDDAIFSEGTYRGRKDAGGGEVNGSLNDYFLEQSAGKFRVTGKNFGWVEVGKKRNDYVLGSGTTNITAVLVEALEKVAKRDGKEAFQEIDGFLFLYAGEQARGNRGGVYFPKMGTIRGFQAKRWNYVIVPEGGPRPTPIGGMVKEFAQMLGLPDLAARTENRGSEGLGAWSALSNPVKTGRPQHLDAWAKEQLGWLRPTVIDPTVPQKLILGAVEGSDGECYKVLVRPDGSEYFLLENRRKTGFDKALPAEGLLIWRVVKDRPLLEESHGIEGPSGPTMHVEEVPYPSPSNHAFTPATTPSSLSPMGGGLPVAITNIRKLPDGGIAFQIGYEYR